MPHIFTWVVTRVRSFLGLDWITEAKEIADASRKRRRRGVEDGWRREEDRHE